MTTTVNEETHETALVLANCADLAAAVIRKIAGNDISTAISGTKLSREILQTMVSRRVVQAVVRDKNA